MAQQTLNVGTAANDGTGDPLRTGMQKANANFTELYTAMPAASSTTPVVDGTAAVGVSTAFARADHVHPTDTSRAPIASPALTGTPTAPTAAGGTNTTQIATTAFVQAAAGGGGSIAGYSSSTPYLLRGTVSARLWSGVTVGTGLSSSARIANLTALQAALDYCDTNEKFFEIEPGDYEIEGSAGLVVNDASHGLVWRGSSLAHIWGYTTNAPVLTLGSTTAASFLSRCDFNGADIRYGVSQTGQTNANALLIGGMWKCHISNFRVDATINAPYRAVYLYSTGAGAFFSNHVEDCVFSFAQQNCINVNITGTGNVWENIYCQGGTIAAPGAVVLPVNFGLGGDDTVINQLNIEGCITNNCLNLEQQRNLTINSLHLEGNRMTGAGPTLVRLNTTGQVTMHGVRSLDTDAKTANTVSGTASIFYVGNNCRLMVTGLSFGQNNNTTNTVDINLVDYATDANGPNYASIEGWGGGGNREYPMSPGLPYVTYGSQSAGGRFVHGSGLTDVTENMVIWIDNATPTTHTHYGVHRDAFIRLQSTIGANKIIVLSDVMRSSAPGATAKRRAGDTCTIRRRNDGTLDAFTVTVRNQNSSGTVLYTGASATAFTQYFAFDGTAWTNVT